MNISAIIIARNEQSNITSCIKSLTFANEILLVDNNSTDNTVQLGHNLGAKVISVAGLDFSFIRNVGKEKAKGDWLFYIDADERVSKELSREIKESVLEKDISAYEIPRQNYYLGHLWPKNEIMLRLIKKSALIGWQGSLHESPLISGKVKRLKNNLLHFAHTDITHMLKKTNEWSEIEAQLRFKSGHPMIVWWRIFRVMITAFWTTFITNSGWKAGSVGLIEGIYQSFSMFVTYAKLWELQNRYKIKTPPYTNE